MLLKKQDFQKLKALFTSAEPPGVEEVREFRRRLAAEPDSGDWPQKLMRIEKALENDKLDYHQIREKFSLDELKRNRFTIRLDAREPFPDCRRQILNRELENLGGRSSNRSETEFDIVVPNSTAEHRIRSLSHWNPVEGD